MANPGLHADDKANLVRRLMAARRAVRDAKASSDRDAEVTAHHVVDEAKRALGERGAVWWDDGAPDLNRQMVKNTPYAVWYSGLARR
jgi:hypothetical protein